MGDAASVTGSAVDPFRLPSVDMVDPVEQARVFEALFREPAPVEHLGRYVVLGTLGSGGMGTVLEAFDRRLDRRVALKVLHADLGEQQRQRLIREAQALAKLSHPNVVQIYEVDESGEQAFIAMELVEGRSLREWMRQEPRPGWRDCVEVFVQAGRGLAAAHARGLIHRDFKPDNVLLGADGRARVADFGLARPVDLPSSDDLETTLDEPRKELTSGAGPQEQVPLTRTGTILGTIAYMAPEQMASHDVDARADQFSFCTALFEAVYGERPFDAQTPMARVVALQCELPEPKAIASAPKWLHRALVRGLAQNPAQRFGSMEALLRELTRPRGRSWKAVVLSTALVGCMGVGSVLWGNETRPCELDRTALGDTWNPDRREALRLAFTAAGASSEQSGAIVARSLDDWSESWLANLHSSCEATRITGIQSEAMLDLRGSCLERQRREANAVVDLLTSTSGKGVGHAFELVESLPDVAVCADPRLQQTAHPLPADAGQREAILAAYEQLSQVRALAVSGRLDEAEVVAESLERTMEGLDHLPLTLEVQFLGVQLSWWRGHVEAGVSAVREVIHQSEIAGLDELSATFRTVLVQQIVGQWGAATSQADALAEAQIAVERLGRPDDRRHALLAEAGAAWIEDSGDYATAQAQYEANIATARARGDAAEAGRAQQQLARLFIELGRYGLAEQTYDAAETSFSEAYGPSSLDAIRVELGRAYLDLARGDLDAAQGRMERLRVRHGVLLEPGSDVDHMVTLVESKLAFMRGDLDAAEAGFRRVAVNGPDNVQRAEAWQAVGVIEFYRGDMVTSLDAYDRARAGFLATLGPEHPTLGLLDSNRGESLAASGDHQSALVAFASALNTLERALPPEHPDLALPYKGRGQSRLALGARAAARVDLERALRIHEQHPGEPVERADVEFLLAQAMDQSGERDAARTLATSARDRLLELGHADRAVAMTRWLDEHDRVTTRHEESKP